MTTSKKVLDFLVDYCEQKHWPLKTTTTYRSSMVISHVKVKGGVRYTKVNCIQIQEYTSFAAAALLTHEVGHCIDFARRPFSPQPMAVYRHDNGTEYVIDGEVYEREQAAWVEGIALLRRHELFSGWFKAYTEAVMHHELSCYWTAYLAGVKFLAKGEHKGILSNFKVNPGHKNYRTVARQ